MSIKDESEHLSDESNWLITCLNNYSVQIAPEHHSSKESDGIIWQSMWPVFTEGAGIDNLLKHIGFTKEPK